MPNEFHWSSAGFFAFLCCVLLGGFLQLVPRSRSTQLSSRVIAVPTDASSAAGFLKSAGAVNISYRRITCGWPLKSNIKRYTRWTKTLNNRVSELTRNDVEAAKRRVPEGPYYMSRTWFAGGLITNMVIFFSASLLFSFIMSRRSKRYAPLS